MSAKSWADQPVEVEEGEILCTISLDSIRIEIRKTNDTEYYFTAGTLWGSQTLRCRNAEAVIRMIEIVQHRMQSGVKGTLLVPDGYELLPAPEKVTA